MRARTVAACLALGGNLLVSLPLFAAHTAASPKGAASQEAPTVGSVSTVVAKVKCTPAKGSCLYGNGVGVVFEGLRWGMSRKQLVEAYGRPGGIIDQEYNPELARMQPGRAMTAKESERDDKKRAFENSFVEFKSTPTGYDASAIRAEYTYRNKEGVMAIETRGLRRYFFFIGAEPGERLWKVYDEVRLGDDSVLGKTFQDAAVNTTAMLAQPGRVAGREEPPAGRRSLRRGSGGPRARGQAGRERAPAAPHEPARGPVRARPVGARHHAARDQRPLRRQAEGSAAAGPQAEEQEKALNAAGRARRR
jgi:hypothetical protein